MYDLTTLKFESTREDLDNFRRFGYSKEKRSDYTQVVFGLLTNTDLSSKEIICNYKRFQSKTKSENIFF